MMACATTIGGVMAMSMPRPLRAPLSSPPQPALKLRSGNLQVLSAHNLLSFPGSTHCTALSPNHGSILSLASSSFTEGESGNFTKLAGIPLYSKGKRGSLAGGPRASNADDVPAYKGFAPMLKKPRWWWRVLACIPYLMPLSETWMYAETAYSLHAFLEDYEFATYRFLGFIGTLPGWFLLAYFFGAYLGIVRNNRWPHFLRFHVVTGMLLEILVQVVGTVNDWVPESLYWGKFGAHYWLAIAFAFFFVVLECIRCAVRGMYADVPFISDAAYMQIPYDT